MEMVTKEIFLPLRCSGPAAGAARRHTTTNTSLHTTSFLYKSHWFYPAGQDDWITGEKSLTLIRDQRLL